jgi:hypothetical protein
VTVSSIHDVDIPINNFTYVLLAIKIR